MTGSSFLLALCQPGAERALKTEAKVHGLSSSFQRPGLVTFKAPFELDVDKASAFPSVFGRYAGLSLGRVEGGAHLELADAVAAKLAELPTRRLHVVATDGEGDDSSERAFERADALRTHLVSRDRARGHGGWRKQEDPEAGELVATVVLVDDDAWIAAHRHGSRRSPFPGGRMRPQLPEGAPSRAWLKLEEAARIFELPFAPGQRALELGSAPGGATKNMLDRGLEVIGVDPNEMDPGVLASPRFRHLRTTSMSVAPESLPPCDWIVLDVNVPPRTALRGALPFVKTNERHLLGLVFTLKMKSWDLADEVDGWLRRIRHAAPRLELVPRQLSTNGQEICVVGLPTTR